MIVNPSTVWNVPDTDENARPTAFQKVPRNRRVIHIAKGNYRDATFSGYFVIAEVEKPYSTYGEKRRVEVECLWYARKTRNNWPRITIIEGGDVVTDYTGDVVTNISGTRKRKT